MKINFSFIEIREILIAAFVLSLTFSIAMYSNIFSVNFSELPFLILFSFIAVGIGFLAHELIGHKIIAQRFGLFAEFRMWKYGLIVALLSSMAGFVFAAPGAVYISQKLDLWGKPTPVTGKRMGIIGLAGPIVNVIVGLAFFGVGFFYNMELFYFGTVINMWLALFNMIPIPPLDGSKVLAWDRRIFALSIILIGALWYFTVYMWPTIQLQI